MVCVPDAVLSLHRLRGAKLTQREDHLGGVGGEAALADGCLDSLKIQPQSASTEGSRPHSLLSVTSAVVCVQEVCLLGRF